MSYPHNPGRGCASAPKRTEEFSDDCQRYSPDEDCRLIDRKSMQAVCTIDTVGRRTVSSSLTAQWPIFASSLSSSARSRRWGGSSNVVGRRTSSVADPQLRPSRSRLERSFNSVPIGHPLTDGGLSYLTTQRTVRPFNLSPSTDSDRRVQQFPIVDRSRRVRGWSSRCHVTCVRPSC